MFIRSIVTTLVLGTTLETFAQPKPKPSASTLGDARAAESDAGTATPPRVPLRPVPDAGIQAAPTPPPSPHTPPPSTSMPARPPPMAGVAPVAAELEQLKPFVGTWRCEGSIPASALGPARSYKAMATVSAVLDGRWYEVRYQQRKDKENPTPLNLIMIWGYDAGAKQFHRTSHSNQGSWDVGTSPGWQGDNLVWTGETGTPMGKLPFRNTVVRKSARELTLSTEVKAGAQWLSGGSDTCRR